jgi:hypothetical protein
MASRNLFDSIPGSSNTVVTASANAANAVLNAANNAPKLSGAQSYIVLAGFALLLMLFGIILYYRKWLASPWWEERFGAGSHVLDWLNSLRMKAGITTYGGVQTVTPAEPIPGLPPAPRPTQPAQESWCFVGEDLMGRFCVKVPSRGACTPERHYSSRAECELVQAMQLPAGPVTQGGASMQPLSKMNIR